LKVFFIFFLFLVSGTCLDGFEHHDSHCYKVAALEASWMEAKVRHTGFLKVM
jgi:hypothetical protein